MSKVWQYKGKDEKLHLTPEEAEKCRLWKEKAARDWAAYVAKRRKEGKTRWNTRNQ